MRSRWWLVAGYRDCDTREHHSNLDFRERVRPGGLKEGVVLLASFAWHTAMRDGMIPR